MNDFHTALFQANLLFGIEMPIEDFEEIGLIAWNLIGNKNVRLYKYTGEIDSKTLSLDIPCNVDLIEAVTSAGEDWNYTSNTKSDGDLKSAYIEDYIEVNKDNTNPLYINGRYINYQRVEDKLFFDKDYGKVNVLYKGVILDDDGLPFLNDKEVLAIATFIAYRQKFKEGIITNNSNIILMALLLQQLWNLRCDLARIPYLDQNDMNDILDAKTSWNRKIYNKSYKPLK